MKQKPREGKDKGEADLAGKAMPVAIQGEQPGHLARHIQTPHNRDRSVLEHGEGRLLVAFFKPDLSCI